MRRKADAGIYRERQIEAERDRERRKGEGKKERGGEIDIEREIDR